MSTSDAVSTVITNDNKKFVAFTTFHEKKEDSAVDGYMAQLFQAMIHNKIVTDPESFMITCNIFPSDGGIHFSVCMRDTTTNIFKSSDDVIEVAQEVLNSREDKCHTFRFDLTTELQDSPYWYHGHVDPDDKVTSVLEKMKASFKNIKDTVSYLSFGGSKTSKKNS